MGSKADRRAQKKREKQKKKRQDASRTRASRPSLGSAGPERRRRADVSGAVDWPVGECFLSETWSDHGPRIHAGFVRRHANGRAAAVFFAADLRDGGVSDILPAGDVSEDAITGEVARRSELAGHALAVAEPDLVVKVFHTALTLGDDNGVARPEHVDQALLLFDDLDGTSVDYRLLTGEPPPPPPKKQTLFGLLFGWLG